MTLNSDPKDTKKLIVHLTPDGKPSYQLVGDIDFLFAWAKKEIDFDFDSAVNGWLNEDGGDKWKKVDKVYVYGATNSGNPQN